MKKQCSHILLRTSVLVSSLLAGILATQAQVTLINETFSDGLRNGSGRDTQWYSTANSGVGHQIEANTTFGGDYAMRFYSSYSNSIAVASFSPVTLAKAGDYIQISAKVYYTSLGTSTPNTTNTGPLLGLFNSGATQLGGDEIGSTAGAVWFSDDAGYRATKLASSASNDIKIFSAPVGTTSFYNWSGTTLKTESSGFSMTMGTVYTVTLKLQLADNLTDLDISYKIEGGTETNVVGYSISATTTATTLTFNEAVIGAFSGQSGTNAYMSDILVKSNIPEPATITLWIGMACLFPLAWRLRRH